METKESKRGQKLYYYLSRLSPKELKDFHAYLSSPLLGNSAQMARMLLTIEAEVLARGNKVIDADIFQTEFFPDQALDEGKRKYIRIRLVQMLDRLLDFAAFMEYKSDTNAQHLSLLKTMYTRGWEKYFERTYQEIEAMPPKKDFGEYHLYRMRREIVRNDFLSVKATSPDQINLDETVERIDVNFVLYALKYGTSQLNAHIIWGTKIETRFHAVVQEFASQKPFSEINEIAVYTHAFNMLDAFQKDLPEADEHFQKLKKILHESKGLDKSDASDIFTFAHNFSKWSIRKNRREYVHEIQDLYLNSLESNILTTEGMIKKALYSSIVNQMCQYGEIKWSARFAEDWKDRIIDDKDRSTYFVTRSLIHILLDEFDKTIEILHPRIGMIDDLLLGLNARIYLCRAIWGKKDYQWLSFQLEAFRQFVSRVMKNDKAQKAIHLRFLAIFNQMCQAQLGKPDQVRQKLEKIKLSMESNQETIRYFWIYRTLSASLEKIELKN